MKITIGVTSYNRGLYLNALLHSISDEVKKEDHQLIVVDNASDELAVTDAIDAHDDIIASHHMQRVQNWINDEYIAKNLIIDEAKHDVILFLQDDMQFIGPPGHLSNGASALMDSHYLWTTVNTVRRSTVRSTIQNVAKPLPKHNIVLWPHADVHFHTTGFFKKAVFDAVGHYPTNWPLDRAYWGRSEDWYDQAVKEFFGSHLRGAAEHVPTFAPVWNDPRGGYAFNRDGRRWGHYEAPIQPHVEYYARMTPSEYAAHRGTTSPRSFVDVAKPLGWSLALDETGDIKKYPQLQIMKEG